MTRGITVKTKVHFGRGPESKKQMRNGDRPDAPRGRVPCVAKLMAPAIKFEQKVRDCEVTDYAELARPAGSRHAGACVSQPWKSNGS